MSRDVSASLDMTTQIEKAVVLAAGRGTRMRELTSELPKPMIEVRGKPVLQHIVEGLHEAGIRKFLIIVGYHADAVQNFFANGSRYNIDIQYADLLVNPNAATATYANTGSITIERYATLTLNAFSSLIPSSFGPVTGEPCPSVPWHS